MVTVDTISQADDGDELIVVTSDDGVHRLPYECAGDEWCVYVVDDTVPDEVADYLHEETQYRIGRVSDGDIVPFIEYPYQTSVDIRQDNVIESHLHHNELLPTEHIDHADLSAFVLSVEIHEDGTTVVTDLSLWPERTDIYFADDALDGLPVVDKDAVTEGCCT